MKALRLTEMIAQGRVAGNHVFIRADLNVPQDDAGRNTEVTRVRASVPCVKMALDAGAAVMVTSHLGRPTEDERRRADSLAPLAARLAGLLGRGGVTLAAIARYGIDKHVGYNHIGGGAFFKVLNGKTLRAFEILARRAAEGEPS